MEIVVKNNQSQRSLWHRLKWWLLGIFLFILLVFSLFVPLPYYLEVPGGAFDINNVLKVDGQKNKQKGSYEYVAVGVSHATLAQLIYGTFADHAIISTAEDTTGGYSDDDYMRINQFYMDTSQNTAIYQALKLAGKEVKLEYKGVYVLDVAKNSTFKDKLHLADTVTGVNGKTFKSSKELIDYVAGLKLGNKVSVQYTSDKQAKSATGKVIKLSNGKNGIGIGLTDHTEVSSDTKVTFNTEGVGGPSAGLMFTLAIYDQVSGKDLQAGRKIAGTGTIEQAGSVGDIGGAGLKVISAAESGADIFFVPNNPVDAAVKKQNPQAKTNYQEAKDALKGVDTKMKIVPVKSLQEAVDYLEKTKGKE